MKKLFAILLTMAILFSVASCTSTPDKNETESNEETTSLEIVATTEATTSEFLTTNQHSETTEASTTVTQQETTTKAVVITTAPPTTAFVSEYEKAYVRELGEYNLYYMFDTDNKKVVTFSYEQGYADKGTYTGDLSTGVRIVWDHGEWTETFKNPNGSSTAVVTDGNGFDWEYKVCDVETAQNVLDLI